MLRDTHATPAASALADISSKFVFAAHHDQIDSIRVVPDADLLFSGQYTRSGNDLVLSHDGRRLVVPDYFGHGKPATLSSAEGATLSGEVVELLAGSPHDQYAQAGPGTAGGPTAIGRVEMASGTATVVRNGVATHLNVGDLVFKNDVIETATDSAVGIGFVDGTAFRLSAHARMVLNEFVYDPNGSSNSALLTLVQGSIGFIAGKVAKTGDMKVDTPVATLGIRGTAVEVDIPIDLTATNGTVRFSVMVELDGTTGAYEILDRLTGAPLASVNLPTLVFLATPTVPGQPPTIATALKSPLDFANEQQVVSQVSQYAAHMQQFPINANPQTAPGSSSPPPNNPNNNLNGTPENPLAQNSGATTSTALNNTSSTQSTQSTNQLLFFLLGVGSTPGIPVFDLAPQIAPTQIANAAKLLGAPTSIAINGFDPSISADGRFIVFEAATTVPATGAEQAGPAQVVLFDRTTHAFTSLGPNITGEFYSNPSISLDGNFVVFQGQSQSGGQPGAQPDIYFYDRTTKQTTLLTAPNSTASVGGSAPHISADGQFITMQHAENGVLHVLVTDRNGTILDDISSTGGVNSPNISANGRFVTFWSTDSKIEVNGSVAATSSAGGAAELYVFDRVTGTVSPIAVLFSGEPKNATALETSASMSADGRFIVFASDAENPLVPGGPEGHSNIFVYDQTTGQIRNLSLADNGGAANGDSVTPQISADDRFVTFSSSASNLVANNTNGVAQTYLYNLTTNTLTLASANAQGAPGNGASSFGSAVSTDGIIVSLASLASDLKQPTVNLYVVDESGGTAGTVVDDPSVHVLTTSGKLYFSDTAQGATYTVSVAAQAGAEGTLTAAVLQAPTGAASNGQVKWIYHVAEAQAATLAAGQSEVNTFSILLNDGTGGVTSQSVTVTIIGTRPLVTEPIFWTNGAGGDFGNAANWSTSAVPGLGDQVLIDHSGTYTLTSTLDHTIATLGIVADATLSIVGSTFVITNGSASDNAGTVMVGDNAAFEVSGALQNSGTISLQAGLHAATFLVDGDVSLAGGGFLSLTDDGLNTIAGAGAGASLENVDNTISGSGRLGDGSLSITNDALGTIDATGSSHQLIIDTGGSFFTNDGVLEATGPAGMLIQNTTVTNNRIVEVSGSSSLQVDGAFTFTNTFAASIEVDNSASFSATNLVNDNLVTVNDQGSFTVVNNLTNGDPTLLDLGIISMNSSGTLTSENINNTFFGEIEVNSGELIDGNMTTAGFLDVFGVAAVHSGNMTNSGDITINDSAAIYNTTQLVNENVGFITLSGSTTMQDSSDTNSGQIELFDSSTVVDNILDNTDIGFIFILDSATFTVSGGGTNAGSIFIGDFGAGEDANLELAGTLDNSGRIELDGSGYSSAPPTVGGAGIIILAGGATLQGGGQIALLGGTISGAAGGATLTNVADTISGFGNIGDGSNDLTLVNDGIIDGNDKLMTLDTGSDLITNAGVIQAMTNAVMIQASEFSALQIGSPISNTGTMEAVAFASLDIKGSLDNSGTGTVEAMSVGILTIDSTTTNSGTVEASGGGIVTVNGVTTNSGSMEATDNGTLNLLNVLNNTGTLLAQDGNVIVAAAASGSGHAQMADGILEYDALSSLATDFDAGAVGGLKLGPSSDFSGTVSGFALGDYFDLEGVDYSSANPPNYVPTGPDSGILTVTDGDGHTVSIIMAGSYASGDFFESRDSNGGTYITETQPVSWANPVDGDFADTGKWDSGFVPTSADDAFITIAGPAYTVTSSVVESVNSISVGADATLAIGGSSMFTVVNGTEFGSIAGKVTVGDGSTLALHWNIDNSGVVSLNSNGLATTVSIVGSTTLSGQGQINLTDNANNVITGAGAGAMLTNVDNTISGSGQLGGGQLTLINDQHGTIDATGPDAPLIIDTQGNVVINDGALEATGLAVLVIADTAVDSSAGGFVSKAETGGTVELQSGVLLGGTIDGLVHVVSGDSALDGTNGTVTIDASGDVEVLDGQQLTLRSSISIGDGGVIKLDASSANTTLLIDTAGASLSGGGSIELSDDSHNIITGVTANATLTNVDDTISGSGLLGNSQLTLVNEANGLIVATGATNALIVDTYDNTLVNDGTMQATGAAGLEIEDTKVDGSRGFVGDIVADAGSLVELNGATLFGGTLISHGNGVVTVIGGSIFDGTSAGGLTNSAAVEMLDGEQLTMRGSITNTDSISLESTGDVTTLMIDSEGVTLNGGGTINLSDNSNNIITGATAGAELDNVDNTISGSGQLGDGQLTLINGQPGGLTGTIDASDDDAPLVIDTQGVTFTNYGTLEATGAAGLVIEDTTVDSTGGGFVSIAGAGGTVELQNSALLGGTIDGLLNVIGGDSVLDGTNGAVTIDATGNVTVLDGQQLTLRGSISIGDGGIIGLDASGDTTTLLIDTAGASLSGGGSIELSDDGHNIITGVAVTATLTNVDDTIEGSGLLGNGQLTLVNDANGVIAATGDANALTVDTEGKVLVNDGTLKATGTAGLVIENTTVDGTGGGVIGKTNTGTVELQNATIVGGSLEGAIDTGSSASTLDGTEQAVTNLGSVTVGDGDQLVLSGTIDNSGSILLDSQGDATTLEIGTANATLDSGGQITLSADSANLIIGLGPTATLTNDDTIAGSGELGNGQLTFINENAGIVDANAPAAPLVVDTQGSVLTNDGILEASQGGNLTISDTTVDGSGGGFIEANGANSVAELDNADLLGGTLATSGGGHISVVGSTFDGTQNKIVTNTGDVVLGDGQQLTLKGIIDNDGAGAVINIQANGDDTTLSIAGTATLEGNGNVTLSDDTHNIIAGSAPGAALTNQDNTISGAGKIDGTDLTLSNEKAGLIDANGTNALDLDFQGGVITNAGAIEATGEGGLTIEGDVKNASTGLVEANHGNVSVSGDVTGGAVGIVDATLDVSGALSANVDFFTSTGMLKLGAPALFTGKISGFTGDGTLAGSDQIDLANIDRNSAHFNGTFNSATDTLTVTDGTHTAHLKFVGTYSQDNFSFASDGDGGTIVYDPPTPDQPKPRVEVANDAFIFHAGTSDHVGAGLASGSGEADRIELDGAAKELDQLLTPHLAELGAHEAFIDVSHGDPAPWVGMSPVNHHALGFMFH